MKTVDNMPGIFLGATGKDGFINKFSGIYSEEEGWRAYIIKGGPGSGKSTFLKRIAEAFSEEDPIICRCSSDPKSLDAVILPKRKVMLADGTAPHVLEPDYPGARERVLNFFDIFDSDKLYSSRDAVIEAFEENAKCHRAAGAYIKAAGELFESRFLQSELALNRERAEAYADSLSKRLFKSGEQTSREYRVYFDAMTPDGFISLTDSHRANFGAIVQLDDEYGAAADVILHRLAQNAKSAGLSAVIGLHPILPGRVRQIYIPAIGWGINVGDFLSKPSDPDRTVHAKRFYDSDGIYRRRTALSFEKKGALYMLNAAADALRMAKLSHDRLEKYYIGACDFSKVDDIFKKTAREISC